jgi:hypothetical protein
VCRIEGWDHNLVDVIPVCKNASEHTDLNINQMLLMPHFGLTTEAP